MHITDWKNAVQTHLSDALEFNDCNGASSIHYKMENEASEFVSGLRDYILEAIFFEGQIDGNFIKQMDKIVYKECLRLR